MENSAIEWTDHTFNPWWGCAKISPGCKNCYAASFAKRTGNDCWEGSPRRYFGDEHWKQPVKWNRDSEKAWEDARGSGLPLREPRRHRVFCASMADVFEGLPEQDEHVGRLLALINDTPHLDWLLLTKRPENIEPLLRRVSNGTYGEVWNLRDHMPNVWLGTTVEDQQRADERIPVLLGIPAKVRFLSCEPMCGPVSFRMVVGLMQRFNSSPWGWHNWLNTQIHWVICGGESGAGARPMHPGWARSLRDQCAAGGVPFFFKQWGEWMVVEQLPATPEGRARKHSGEGYVDFTGKLHPVDEAPLSSYLVWKIGKKAAGRLLDGVLYGDFPAVDGPDGLNGRA